ncbi:MAG TPA: DUF4129 domain-containing protein [Thermomicrobiales bacterium]|nr:DUF4129 domain-containing protein [Thermomicrobiales bacterium]
MSSNASSSPASPERRFQGGALRQRWPTLIVLPALIALLGAAAISPLIALFLGESFGISGGRDAPWPWAFAIIGLLAFWSAKVVGRLNLSLNASAALLFALGLVTVALWWALEPTYDLGPVLRDPVSLVSGNGHLVVPMLIALGVWYQGLRYDFNPSLFAPEEIRGNVQRSWAILAGSIVLAAIVGGDTGDAGIAAAGIAVPVAMICSAGAVAASEINNTRSLARRRGSTAPGWDRWARFFAGIVVGIVLITGIAAILLGPGALDLVMEGLRTAFRAFGVVLYWVMFGFIYALYWVYRFVAWILNSLFGDLLPEMQMPEVQQAPVAEHEIVQPEVESEEAPYATILRLVALGIALLVVAVIVFRLSRAGGSGDGEGEPDEERESVFSTSLARQQLRDLFRRKPKPERPRKLNLDRPPQSVREGMLYLQVLASRQRVPRSGTETPADFTTRLASEWPSVAAPLQVIRDRYEVVRYGETEQDPAAVVDAWRIIWQHRKDAPLPVEPEDART